MSKHHHILIVDDEAVHRETLGAILASAGIGVTTCASGTEGLAALRRNGNGHFDLILSDVLMPGMDGLEFAREARRISPNAPVVLVTGRDSAMDAVLGDGTVALLKPYSTATLNAILLEYLGVTV